MTEIERLDATSYIAAVPLLGAQLREHGFDPPVDELDRTVQGLMRVAGRGVLLLAREGGQAVGVASLSATWTLEHGGSVLWLEELYVVPEHRGRGIGSELLTTALELARAEGHRAIDLEVDWEHARAAELYLRHGFRKLSRDRFTRVFVDHAPAPTVTIDAYDGDRAALRWLFELAEDSPARIDATITSGMVWVARRGPDIVGLVQVAPAREAGALEILSLAVRTDAQRRGIGRALVASVIQRAPSIASGITRVVVATATADIGNLAFYQRLGFRMASIEHDVFGVEAGYPANSTVDGIALRDRVWFFLDLGH